MKRALQDRTRYYMKKAETILCSILLAALIILLFFRILHSVDLTDEAYYIAETYYASQGKLPFTDIWDPHTGWFLYAPLLLIFKVFSPGLKGVFLFFRIIWLISIIGILTVSNNLISCKFRKKRLLWRIMMLIPACYVSFSIPHLSYNVIVPYLLILVFGFIIAAGERSRIFIHLKKSGESSCWKGKSYLFLAGITMGIACLMYPTLAFLSVLLAIPVFWSGSRGDRFRSAAVYCAGGLLIAAVFLILLLLRSNIGEILQGLSAMTSTPHETNKGPIDWVFIEVAFHDRLKEFFCRQIIVQWCAYIVGSIIAYAAFHKDRHRHRAVMLFLFQVFLLISLFTVLNRKDTSSPFHGGYFLFCLLFAAVILVITFRVFTKEIGVLALLLTGWLLTFVFTSDNRNLFIAIDAAGNIIFFFACYIITVSDENIFGSKRRNEYQIESSEEVTSGGMNNWLSLTGCLVLLLSGISLFYTYVYRDAPLSELDHKVEYGVYAGLYTTAEKKEYVEGLERFVRNVTLKEDKVFVVSLMPSVYLMSNARVCAPQTWDAQFLARGYTSSEPVLSYFEAKKVLPDIIFADNNYFYDIFQKEGIQIWSFIEKYYVLKAIRNDKGFVTKAWEIDNSIDDP